MGILLDSQEFQTSEGLSVSSLIGRESGSHARSEIIADITELPNLLREDDQVIFGDAGYGSDSYRCGARHMGLNWCVNDKRKGSRNLSSSQRKRNRKQSSVRARVEHVFRVIKRQFGFQKTRYRGLEKNASQVNLLVGLANLYMLRRQLAAA